MKRYSLFLVLFSILAISWTQHIGAKPEDDLKRIVGSLERWWYSPSNDDLRVLGLTIAGTTSTIVGLLLIKKGIEQTLSSKPHAQENSSNAALIWQGVKNICSRITGCGITCFGLGITGSGVALIVFNKEVIMQLERAVDQNRC